MKKAFGPGLLFAATAIGVSHLVQSTRAGAEYGWGMLVFILLANWSKYPFFEFGTRYANVKGESLLEGYKSLGQWSLHLYTAITVVSMFTVTGAVSLVAAGLFAYLIGAQEYFEILVVGLFALCVLWLMLGKFKWLDGAIKAIVAVLFISTIVAFALAWDFQTLIDSDYWIFSNWDDAASWMFIIALMGWMPTAVDLSVWNSLWTVEKSQQLRSRIPLRGALADFNFGYWASAVSALLFLGLGVFLLFGGSDHFPEGAVAFSTSLIDMYASVLGEPFRWVIATAAAAAMFSTVLSVFDGYGRTTSKLLELYSQKRKSHYWMGILIVALGSYALIAEFRDHMLSLVQGAMIISFLTAPVVAYLNHRLVHAIDFPEEGRPPRWLSVWSKAALITLVVFSLSYFIVLLFLND